MLRAPALVLAIALLAACGGDDSADQDAAETRSAQARQIARDAGLSPAVQDFMADAAGAVGRTYSVEYRLGESDRSTVVQDPPHRRLEFALQGDGVPVTRLFITNDDGTFGCAELAGEWSCQRNSEEPAGFGPLALGDVEEATQDLVEATADYSFAIESRRLAGVTARCLVTERKPGRPADPARGDRGVLCISPEGVPLLIEGSQGNLTAVSYRTRAPRDAFRLPARPDGSGPTSTS